MGVRKQTSKGSNLEKDPREWASGDDPMTDAQRSYLKTLMEQAGETFDEDEELTKAEASSRIDELRERLGLPGRHGPAHP